MVGCGFRHSIYPRGPAAKTDHGRAHTSVHPCGCCDRPFRREVEACHRHRFGMCIAAGTVPDQLRVLEFGYGPAMRRTDCYYHASILERRPIESHGPYQPHSGPDQSTLADAQLSIFLPAYADRPVYYGHWSETPDYRRKLGVFGALIKPSVPPALKRALLLETECDYVILEFREELDGLGNPSQLGLTKCAQYGESLDIPDFQMI